MYDPRPLDCKHMTINEYKRELHADKIKPIAAHDKVLSNIEKSIKKNDGDIYHLEIDMSQAEYDAFINAITYFHKLAGEKISHWVS